MGSSLADTTPASHQRGGRTGLAQKRAALAVNDPATAVQVLDAIQSILGPLVTRDLDVAEITDGSGAVRVILAFLSWDGYLRINLDDLIESGAQSPLVLLRARVLLISLLATAPAQRRPSIAWRLQHTEDLVAGNFPASWQDAIKDR